MKANKFSSPASPQKQFILPRNVNHSLTPDRPISRPHISNQIHDDFQIANNQNSDQVLSTTQNLNDPTDPDTVISNFSNPDDIYILISSSKGEKSKLALSAISEKMSQFGGICKIKCIS